LSEGWISTEYLSIDDLSAFSRYTNCFAVIRKSRINYKQIASDLYRFMVQMGFGLKATYPEYYLPK
jgi:hypothetical protein